MASNAENVSIWWRHNVTKHITCWPKVPSVILHYTRILSQPLTLSCYTQKKIICIFFYHFLALRWQWWLKSFLVEDNDPFSLHVWWRPGDARSQVISNHGIDIVITKYPCFNTRHVKNYGRWRQEVENPVATHPADTQRNNNVIITSKRRRFDLIKTLLLRVTDGFLWPEPLRCMQDKIHSNVGTIFTAIDQPNKMVKPFLFNGVI